MAITIRFTGETSKMSWVALPVIERIQNACCKHHNDVDMSWEDFVKKMSE